MKKPLTNRDIMNLEIKGFEIVNRKKRIVKRKPPERIEIRKMMNCESWPAIEREMRRKHGYLKTMYGNRWLVVER